MIFGGKAADFSIEELMAFHKTAIGREDSETCRELSPYDVGMESVLMAKLIDLTLAVNSDPKKRPKEDQTILAGFDREKRQKRIEMKQREEMAKKRYLIRLAEMEAKKKAEEA